MTLEQSDKYLFGGNRELAIQRDGEKCVKCGMTRQQHRDKYGGTDITVDHIDDNGVHKPKHLKNNSLDNLQTLCFPCHARKDNRSKRLTDEQVINIRHMKGSVRPPQIALLYGITQRYTLQLLAGTWRKNLLPTKEEATE